MKQSFGLWSTPVGVWSEALTGFMFFCPKFGQKILEKPSNWNLPAQEELFSPLLLWNFYRTAVMQGMYYKRKTLIFSFSHNMSEANASYCGAAAEQCFIAEWNGLPRRNEMKTGAASSEKAFYEVLCVLHASGVSSTQKYEAHLRCMKQSCGLWSTPVGVWSEAFSGFMFFCPKFGQKNGVQVTVSAPSNLPEKVQISFLQIEITAKHSRSDFSPE